MDDVQLWRSVIRAVAGTAALVLAGLLLLSLYVPFGFYKSVILPERWRHIPIFMYCVAVPVLSKLVLAPLCRKFTALERHATAVGILALFSVLSRLVHRLDLLLCTYGRWTRRRAWSPSCAW